MPVIAADNLAPPALHIPDGFLHPAIALLSWLITLLILAAALRRTQDQIGERTIPLMGVMAAFIFAAQMINFPVAGRHLRPPARRSARRDRPRPLGRYPGHDSRDRRARALVSGRRPAGDGREYLQYGHPDRPDRLRPLPAGSPPQPADAACRSRRRGPGSR